MADQLAKQHSRMLPTWTSTSAERPYTFRSLENCMYIAYLVLTRSSRHAACNSKFKWLFGSRLRTILHTSFHENMPAATRLSVDSVRPKRIITCRLSRGSLAISNMIPVARVSTKRTQRHDSTTTSSFDFC